MSIDDILEKARSYLSIEEHPFFIKEVEDLIATGDEVELSDRFWRDLDFGTGGLRGVIGGGSNRINPTVIRQATQGLANYIKTRVPKDEWGVAIAYDSRLYSDLFAEEAARVLATNGIRCWLFTSLRPTPVLSFAVRELGACAGIMVTASHNPAAYNGYKVFWSDGAQVVPPHDKGIITEVRRVSGAIKTLSREDAETQGLIVPIDSSIDKPYIDMVIGQCLRPHLVKEKASDLKTVFSPLHGTGTIPVETVFDALGIPVETVPEQREPDGRFPTVDFPNPEMASALKMAIDLAKERKADLVFATDPDADRLGIAVPDGDSWILISGNQLGALLADYMLRTLKEQAELPTNSAFVNTIVTSELQNAIASFYGAVNFRVLTGFKYIGEKIRQFEAESSYTYVFGGEESYGYLVGTAVRDKDAVSAAAMTGEMAIWNRSRGFTVLDHLKELWTKHGYWKELLISRDFEGQSGSAAMDSLMSSLREAPPKSIAGKNVDAVRDYRDGTTTNPRNGAKAKDIDLPTSNVLQFVLNDGSLVTARPSGTEPKIKFYASCRSSKGGNLLQANAEVDEVLSGIEDWINRRIAEIEA